MRRRLLALCALVGLCTSPVGAQEVPAARRVDPRFGAIERVLREHGPASPTFGPGGLPAGTRTDGVSAMLRFRRVLSDADRRELRKAGVRWHERDGKVLHIGGVYGAFVPFAALAALRAHPDLVYAEVAWHPVTVRPLGVTVAEIGGIATRHVPHLASAGSGAVIGDVDSGVDVLHPHMFRADGGAFAWIDSDGDGTFTPGADHVDLDRDGRGGFNEVARVLDGVEYGPGGVLSNDDGELDVARDWLYADANGDEERNAGREAGFTEFDPGYGEPAFVPDDANRSGELDRDERLLLLQTSKVARFVTSARTFTRGEDLIDSVDVSFFNQFLHGTAVASILVGGHSARGRAGVAPDADLVMYASHMDATGNGFEEAAQLVSIVDAADTGVDVLVHEWTNPYTAPMDGAGNLEEAMLNARAAGVVQINPVGNMNLSEKHIELAVRAGQPATLQFEVGPGFDLGDGELLPYAALYGSLYWRGDHEPTFTLRNPSGDAVTLTTDATIAAIGADFCQGTLSESLRGTRQLLVLVWQADGDASVDEGIWTIDVDASVDDVIVGRIADAWSGWARGVRWLGATQDRNTAVYPSTADAAFAVGAYGGRHAQPDDGAGGSRPGELRNYSGRGPRIDGARLLDLAAPDDPFAAWGVSEGWIAAGAGRSWFLTFGGTSGAAPHVAGAVALIRALDPQARALDIEARLLATARRDASTPAMLPDAAWGEGKLDVWAAVTGVAATPNTHPVAALALDGDAVSAAGSSDADGDVLSYRWDVEYDGTWDSDWVADPRVALPDAEPRLVRLEVRDARGGAAGAVLRITASDVMEPGSTPDIGARPDVGVPDAGPAIDPDPVRCGCSSAGESLSWIALLGLFLLRRCATPTGRWRARPGRTRRNRPWRARHACD